MIQKYNYVQSLIYNFAPVSLEDKCLRACTLFIERATCWARVQVRKIYSKGWISPIDYLHPFLSHAILDYENEGFASQARYPKSERVRGWSRVAGIRAASLCALWPRRHPTEMPRVEPRVGSTATGLSSTKNILFNFKRSWSLSA